MINEIKKNGKVLNFLSKNKPETKKNTRGRAIKKPSPNPREIAYKNFPLFWFLGANDIENNY